MGTGSASIAVRKRNPKRIFPVEFLMAPTIMGPKKLALLSVSAKREKKVLSCPGGTSSAYTARA
jgi:hypothetical protein